MSELAKSIQSLVEFITDPNVQRAVVILFVVIVAVIGTQVVFTLRAESHRKKNIRGGKRG